LEIDPSGNGTWRTYTTLTVPDNGYVTHIFPPTLSAQWIRLAADRDCVATAYFHLTDADYRTGQSAASRRLFAGLADAETTDARTARVYAAKRNRNLRVITGDGRYFEFGKSDFAFHPDPPDMKLAALLAVRPEFTVDNASVIVKQGDRRWRLPKGDTVYDKPFASGWPRAIREVESERRLANIHGTFYEVPLYTNDRPPAFELLRPVASHHLQIMDYCSWNGLLVLSGVRSDATNNGHVFTDAKNKTGLWFGGVDDLWQLGKPVGHGGPWKDTKVRANQPSDPYLMTGYDRKTLTLRADQDATVTIEVDFDHQSGWHAYRHVRLSAGSTWRFAFPTGFSAHWIRFRADRDCTATAWLVYE